MFKSPSVISVMFGVFVAASLPAEVRLGGHPTVTGAALLECISARPDVSRCTDPDVKVAGPSTGGLTGTVLAAADEALPPELIG